MKFQHISKLKIDCKKHGKAQEIYNLECSIVCKKCYQEYLKEEEIKSIKRQKEDEEIEKSRKYRQSLGVMYFFPWIFFMIGLIYMAISFEVNGWYKLLVIVIAMLVYFLFYMWFMEQLNVIEEYKK